MGITRYLDQWPLLSIGSAIQLEGIPFGANMPPLKPSLNKVEETIPENKTVVRMDIGLGQSGGKGVLLLRRGNNRGIICSTYLVVNKKNRGKDLKNI